MTVTGLVGVEVGEHFDGVDAQRVQQPVAVMAGAGDHRLFDQRRQQLQRRVQTLTSDAQRGVEIETARKCPESGEERPLVARQQLEAPVDRAAQRLLALGDGGSTIDQQPEAVLESRTDRSRAEHVGAGGGELDRQRKAVESDAHRGDVSSHRVVDVEVRPHCGRPVDEEGRRLHAR